MHVFLRIRQLQNNLSISFVSLAALAGIPCTPITTAQRFKLSSTTGVNNIENTGRPLGPLGRPSEGTYGFSLGDCQRDPCTRSLERRDYTPMPRWPTGLNTYLVSNGQSPSHECHEVWQARCFWRRRLWPLEPPNQRSGLDVPVTSTSTHDHAFQGCLDRGTLPRI